MVPLFEFSFARSGSGRAQFYVDAVCVRVYLYIHTLCVSLHVCMCLNPCFIPSYSCAPGGFVPSHHLHQSKVSKLRIFKCLLIFAMICETICKEQKVYCECVTRLWCYLFAEQ